MRKHVKRWAANRKTRLKTDVICGPRDKTDGPKVVPNSAERAAPHHMRQCLLRLGELRTRRAMNQMINTAKAITTPIKKGGNDVLETS